MIAMLFSSVLKTKEALKEEKLQRKEEEKRRFSGNHDFLTSVGITDSSSQNRRIRLRRTSQTVSECSDTGGGLSPIDAKFKGLRSLTFNMKGETVRVHLIAQVISICLFKIILNFRKVSNKKD
jgi:hypothetical protein